MTTILGGFLGSGKTTVLNQLLNDLNPQLRTAVIINDFGEVNIDSLLIEKGGYSKKEISGGCICCSLKAKLLDTLLQIVNEEKPDEIYIEATGLAVPWEMKQTIEKNFPSDLIRVKDVLVCMDARQCDRYHDRLPAYSRQFEGRPLVLITKADIYSLDVLEQTRVKLQKHYPGLTGFAESRSGCWKKPGTPGIPVTSPAASTGLFLFHPEMIDTGKDGIESLSLMGPLTGTVADLHQLIDENRPKVIRLKALIPFNKTVLSLQFDGSTISEQKTPENLDIKGQTVLNMFCMKEDMENLKEKISRLISLD
jgi:G3E family GTPase